MDDSMKTAFLSWHDEYADAIFRYIYSRVRNYESSRDLTQDVFIRVWRHMTRGYVIEKGRPFLYRVAISVISDWVSKKKDSSSIEELEEKGVEPSDETTESSVHTGLDATRALQLIDRLHDERVKEALILRYVNGLGPKEIAHITGESENVVSVRINRALKKLRKLIEPYET